MTARWRVVRHSPDTVTDVCRHWSERRAWRCVDREQAQAPTGVWFDVRPAVKP